MLTSRNHLRNFFFLIQILEFSCLWHPPLPPPPHVPPKNVSKCFSCSGTNAYKADPIHYKCSFWWRTVMVLCYFTSLHFMTSFSVDAFSSFSISRPLRARTILTQVWARTILTQVWARTIPNTSLVPCRRLQFNSVQLNWLLPFFESLFVSLVDLPDNQNYDFAKTPYLTLRL